MGIPLGIYLDSYVVFKGRCFRSWMAVRPWCWDGAETGFCRNLQQVPSNKGNRHMTDAAETVLIIEPAWFGLGLAQYAKRSRRSSHQTGEPISRLVSTHWLPRAMAGSDRDDRHQRDRADNGTAVAAGR